MPDYAVVQKGVFIERRFYPREVPADKIKHENGVPQLRPLVEDRPSYDPETEAISGPVYDITDKLVTARWTKRALTQQELDAIKDRKVDHDIPQVFLRAFLNLHNRIRALEGQSAHTMAQFKAALKALL